MEASRYKEHLEYYLGQVLMPQLRYIFSQLQEVSWEHLLENTTDFDLLQTRDELCTWLIRWRSAMQYQHRLPDEYPRWQINIHESFYSLSIADQVLVFVCWLALRSLPSS